MRTPGWSTATALFFAVILLTLVAYAETVATFPRIWRESETFTHGILVLPVCAYLILSNRRAICRLTPRPYLLALLFLPVLGFFWLVGHATGTLIVEQFSLVAMVPALVLAFFGPRIARALAFPLCFLFFVVPFGDAFQPSLQEFTAGFAAQALRLTGVPVTREGLYLATPVAVWRVAEACSGLRFLISGFALGCLFAYLNYRSPRKRLVFMGLSIVVPIIANGFRAYVLILVGYMSEMRLAGGFDHYAWGWIVFATVMFAFFAAGSAFRDRTPPEGAVGSRAETLRVTSLPVRVARWVGVALTALFAVSVWPALSSYLARQGTHAHAAAVSPPEPRNGWALRPDPPYAWKPSYSGATSESQRTYVKDGATIDCYIAFYERQHQGAELIQYHNVIVARQDTVWRNVGERSLRVRSGLEELSVRETDVRATNAHLLVWHWYWLPDEFTADPQWAKLLQARARLLHHRDHAAVVVLSTSVLENAAGAAHLAQFVEDMLLSIRQTLRRSDEPS